MLQIQFAGNGRTGRNSWSISFFPPLHYLSRPLPHSPKVRRESLDVCPQPDKILRLIIPAERCPFHCQIKQSWVIIFISSRFCAPCRISPSLLLPPVDVEKWQIWRSGKSKKWLQWEGHLCPFPETKRFHTSRHYCVMGSSHTTAFSVSGRGVIGICKARPGAPKSQVRASPSSFPGQIVHTPSFRG